MDKIFPRKMAQAERLSLVLGVRFGILPTKSIITVSLWVSSMCRGSISN